MQNYGHSTVYVHLHHRALYQTSDFNLTKVNYQPTTDPIYFPQFYILFKFFGGNLLVNHIIVIKSNHHTMTGIFCFTDFVISV